MRLLLVGAGAAYSTKDVEDGYRCALRAAGVDVKFYNLEARIELSRSWLHKLWRARGKSPSERPSWPDAIYRSSIEALEMALRYDVDWVLVISAMYFHPDVLALLRRARKKTAVLFTESPYEDEAQVRVAELVDVCWTNERTSTTVLDARYLRHAYDPTRHWTLDTDSDVPAHDVVFVGTGFEERIHLFGAIDWNGIDLALYGNWTLLGPRSKLRQFVHGGPISNDSAVALYRRAKIGLNLHRSSATYGRHVEHIQHAESINPRTYELAACEVFQISDYRAELVETFGSAIPTFAAARDLECLLRAALADESARRSSAAIARELVRPHTFSARAEQILADLERFADRSLAKGA